ncbi:unnamed protein product [Discula destructiva]
MAPFIPPRKHNARSPSPRGKHGQTARRALGNFRRIFGAFPELARDNLFGHSTSIPGHASLPSATSSFTTTDGAYSPPATPARSLSPRLGNLTKLGVRPLKHHESAHRANTLHEDDGDHTNAQFQTPTIVPDNTGDWTVSRLPNDHTDRDASLTTVEDQPPDTDGASFDDLASKATTPATSPDFSLEIRVKARPVLDPLRTKVINRKGCAGRDGSTRTQAAGSNSLATQPRAGGEPSDDPGIEIDIPGSAETWPRTRSTYIQADKLSSDELFEYSTKAVPPGPPLFDLQRRHPFYQYIDPLNFKSPSTSVQPLPLVTPDSVPHHSFNVVPHLSNPHLVASQQHRSDLAIRVVPLYNSLRSGSEKITLPWDHRGNYSVTLIPAHVRIGVSSNNGRFTIEPYYRVDMYTQLQLVKAQLAVLALDDDGEIDAKSDAAPQVEKPATTQPLHVFVDMSNIVISFYDHLKQARKLSRKDIIQGAQAPFFFQALATILERDRPCAKKMIVGSIGPGRPRDDYMNDAESNGYTVHILQRVKGAKPSKTLPNPLNKPPSPPVVTNAHHEQAVDEILQLHMMESIVDNAPTRSANGQILAPPGTIVLATGDGAPTDFSDGFFSQVMRALNCGWYVEVVGFSRNMNKVWSESKIPKEWRGHFRTIALDPFAEELLESFRG